MRARIALLGLALLAAGCGSSPRAQPQPVRTGPPGVARIALADVPWPLDPARIRGRDQTQLGRVLFATPLRLDSAGRLRPGLCAPPRSTDGVTWNLRCRHAARIALELGRVPGLTRAERIDARGNRLRIVLRRPWRGFPYALTAVAAAPPGVPGPFRVVSARPGRIVAARPGLRLVFRQLEPHAAAVAFRRGELDEAPVALGDIRAARLDPAVASMVHVRPLLGVDLVRLPATMPASLRRVYSETADRQTYDALVPEYAAPAVGAVSADVARQARREIPPHPPALRVAVAPGLRAEAHLATAQWRDLGLGATVAPTGTARFERVFAPYARPAALPASTDRIVPFARVADARLVSPRLVGWRRDALGSVDYAAVRAPAVSPRR